MAIDASTVRCGFAVVGRKNGEPRLRWSGMLDWDSDITHKQRRANVMVYVQELVVEWEPDAIILESLRLFHTDKRTGKPLINFSTIIRLCSMWTTIADAVPTPTYTVATSTWKRIVLGGGRATKKDAQLWVERAWGKKVSHDEADAIGLGCAVIRMASVERIKYLHEFN